MAKIIVVDDETAMRTVIRRALVAAGHEVTVHADGREAIADIARDAPDLLVTDIFMPEMEGLETIRRARELSAAMPIIAMSGVSFEGGDYLQVASRFGAVATLKKPFRPAELLDLVAQLVGETRA